MEWSIGTRGAGFNDVAAAIQANPRCREGIDILIRLMTNIIVIAIIFSQQFLLYYLGTRPIPFFEWQFLDPSPRAYFSSSSSFFFFLLNVYQASTTISINA